MPTPNGHLLEHRRARHSYVLDYIYYFLDTILNPLRIYLISF
jgi:hypothetical protein